MEGILITYKSERLPAIILSITSAMTRFNSRKLTHSQSPVMAQHERAASADLKKMNAKGRVGYHERTDSSECYGQGAHTHIEQENTLKYILWGQWANVHHKPLGPFSQEWTKPSKNRSPYTTDQLPQSCQQHRSTNIINAWKTPLLFYRQRTRPWELPKYRTKNQASKCFRKLLLSRFYRDRNIFICCCIFNIQ